MRTRFKDELLDQQYENDGFAIIRNWANADEIAKMQQIVDEAYKDRKQYYNWKLTVTWNTLVMAPEDVRRKLSEGIMEVFNPLIEKHFVDYRPFFGYTLIKPPAEQPNPINLHRDSSTVGEETSDVITMWLPLVDVNKKNGCMFAAPGSQRLFVDELPFGVEWPYQQYEKSLKKYLVDLPLKAGDLLLFSSKVVHGSYTNQTSSPRHVVSSVLMHPETEALFNYYNHQTNLVNAYQVDPWFFFNSEFDEPVGKYPIKRTYPYTQPVVSEAAIKEFYMKNPIKTDFVSNILNKLGLKSLSV